MLQTQQQQQQQQLHGCSCLERLGLRLVRPGLESRQGQGTFLLNAQTDSATHPASHAVGRVKEPIVR